jgi:hypothetical protein
MRKGSGGNCSIINCSIINCSKKYFAKGYCHNHYENFLRTNNPLGKRYKCFAKNCNTMISNYKYCCRHSKRNSLHRSLDLSIKYNPRGKKHMWYTNGKSEYPNSYLMKKRRLVILKKFPICQLCNKKKAIQVHHKDENKANHSWKNLLSSCVRCNCKQSSKFFKRFGYTLDELSKLLKKGRNYLWNHQDKINDFLLDK